MSGRTYQSLTADAVEQLAQDIVAGRVVHSLMVPRDLVESVFLVLGFLEGEALEDLRRNDITVAYEYVQEAGPASINGWPSFLSVNYLDRGDAERVFARAREIARILRDRRESAATQEASA